MKSKLTIFLVLSVGFISLNLQITIIRLLLEFLQGNEISIGLALALWLLGSSLGSLLIPVIFSQRIRKHGSVVLLLPVVMLEFLLIKMAPRLFHLIPGTPVPFSTAILIFFLTIFPVAVLCGALFPWAVGQLSLKGKARISENIRFVYIIESIGALLGALVVNFLLFNFFHTAQIIALILLVFYLPLMVYQGFIWKQRGMATLSLIYFIASISVLLSGSRLTNSLNSCTYAPYQVVEEKDTPYGNQKVLEHDQQKIVTSQGIIEYVFPDPYSAEIDMYVPLLLHPYPRTMLIVSGNFREYMGILGQISTIEEVVYLETNPYLMQLQSNPDHPEGEISRKLDIRYVNQDIREYLQDSPLKFDVITVHKPEPVTLYDNRYYTEQFFSMIRHHLKNEGILCFSIKSSENYINTYLASYISLLRKTLEKSFQKVFIVPGNENIFLASPSGAFIQNLKRWPLQLEKYQAQPSYLTPPYWNYRLSPERIKWFDEQLEKGQVVTLNGDFNLKGYTRHFMVWYGFSNEFIRKLLTLMITYRLPVSILVIILFVLPLMVWRQNSEKTGMYQLFSVSGISMGLELLLILEYQILYGTLYSALAILFGLFLFGTAVGAWRIRPTGDLQIRLFKNANYLLKFWFLNLSLFLPVLVEIHQDPWNLLLKWIFIPAAIFVNGWLLGGYFTITTLNVYTSVPGTPAGLTYGIDIAGGVFAAFLVSVLFIPAFGIPLTLLLMLIILAIQILSARFFLG